MTPTSLPQPRNDVDPREGVEGPASCRSCDQGDVPGRSHGRPEGRRLPPALEPPPVWTPPPIPGSYDAPGSELELPLTPRPARAGSDARTANVNVNVGSTGSRCECSASFAASGACSDCRSGLRSGSEPCEPGEGAKPPTPMVHTLPGKSRSAPDVAPPAGQRAFDLPGAQLGLDGRSYAPTPHPAWEAWLDSAPAPWEDGEDLAEPEPPVWLEPGQPALPPLEPWLRREPLLPLFGQNAAAWDRSRGEGEPGYEVSMTPAEWRESVAECLAHAAACLRQYPELHPWAEKKRKKSQHPKPPVGLRLIEYVERNAREILDCDQQWRMPVADCGAHDNDHSILIDGCDSKCCQRCQNTRASVYGDAGKVYAKSHPVITHQHGKKRRNRGGRDNYMGTFTIAKPPTFTVLQLRREVEQLQRAAHAAWRNVFRYLPRKRAGHYGEYPGVCAEAGMIRDVEFGPHMNPHSHYNRHGAYHWSEDTREATGGNWTHDGAVRDKRGRRGANAQADAFAETIKYAFPMSNKPGRHSYLHPWYATLITIATFYKHMVQGYGTMAGLVKQAEDALLEARGGVVPQTEEVERDILARLNLEPCPHCGDQSPGHWRWRNVRRDIGLAAIMLRVMQRAQAPPGGT